MTPMSGERELDDARGVRTGEAERLRRGEADAVATLADDHVPRLYRVAIRLTGRREDAEDLVQEAIVRALPALERFEGRSSLATYLTRVLVNLWKNRLRSRSRSRLVDWVRGLGDERAEPAADEPTPLDGLEAEDRARAVRSALLRVAPERRLALVLREVEGLSYEQIAEITGVPVGTVRSRLARARTDLRRLLGSGVAP